MGDVGAGKLAEVRLAVMGCGGQGLGDGADGEGRLVRQDLRHARTLAHGLGMGRQDRVDLVDDRVERGVLAIAWLGQRYGQLRADPPGIGGEDQDAVAHQHRLLDVVGHHQHRSRGKPPAGPQVEEIGPERLGGKHVERREGFVHQEDDGIDHQGAGEADALTHAAGQLPGIGGLEAVEANQLDRRRRLLPGLPLGQAQRVQPHFHVAEHGQPGKQGEGLEDHGDSRWRSRHRRAAVDHLALGRADQAGGDPQDGGLSRSRAPEEAQDLAVPQTDRDV